MTYSETLEYLFSRTTSYEQQGAGGYKPGLDNIVRLDEHLGHPHENFRSIHIAGTNGKGSVSHTIAAMLQVCGYKVGLYTSPHLVDFCERIRVNGTTIPEDYVANFVERQKDIIETVGPSFFEITTAMAFKYFSDQEVDIAVIETGLGGRLDSTNIITPVLSVITNISLDHMELLGSSLEQIAMEKAGIIKPGVPVVVGEVTPETRIIFDAIAQEQKAPITYASDQPLIESHQPTADGHIAYTLTNGLTLESELAGSYQPANTNTLLHVAYLLSQLGYLDNSSDDDSRRQQAAELNEALTHVCTLTGLMGRWQIVREAPTVVCDTGHNPAAWEYLSRQLAEVRCREMRIVFGMVDDKDIYSVMQMLPKNARYYYTKAHSKRAFPETSLKVFGDQFGLNGEAYPTVEEAFQAAIDGTTSDDFIFVGGSSYVVGEYLKTRI